MQFKVPTCDDVSADGKKIFDILIKGTGKVPNLCATIGYSGNALGSYLSFFEPREKVLSI